MTDDCVICGAKPNQACLHPGIQCDRPRNAEELTVNSEEIEAQRSEASGYLPRPFDPTNEQHQIEQILRDVHATIIQARVYHHCFASDYLPSLTDEAIFGLIVASVGHLSRRRRIVGLEDLLHKQPG